MRHPRTLLSILLSLALLATVGCAGGLGRSTLQGPTRPAPVRVEQWYFRTKPARTLVTPHYRIHTTITDNELALGLAQLMEGAYAQYRTLAPDVPESREPMDCYLFASRDEWAAFTRVSTGADSAIYLQINRGGYTVKDWYVAYFIGDVGTYSVAAHEGWHQYVARHFKTRVPPFLEEGLACLFEEVRWQRGLPRWDLAGNGSRKTQLRNVLGGDALLPLDDLIVMHAGKVVNRSLAEVEAFYAQSWAFGRFLWEADGGRHRPALRRMLADAAAGNLHSDGGLTTDHPATWNPGAVRPMLEHYLGMPLPEIDESYQRYMRELASRGAQWAAG